MTTAEDYAWAAGFFDGEGYVHAKRGKRKSDPQRFTYTQIILDIAQKERELLDRFASIVGVGKVYGPYRNGASGHNASHSAYRFMVCKYTHVRRVYSYIAPWLGAKRRRQFQEAFEFWENKERMKPGKKVKKGTTYP